MIAGNMTNTTRRLFPMFAVVCAIGATSLSWLMGRGQSLWFDEQYSLILASRPVRELMALTAVDAHPPLYYLLLKAWMTLAGDGAAPLRLLACLFLGGTVLVSLVMMRDLFGERVAALCAPLLLCGGFMLRYGYELRMYSMAMLIVVSGTYVLLRATGTVTGDVTGDTKGGWWAAYALVVALGMYTLYLTAFVWIAHAIWLVWMGAVHGGSDGVGDHDGRDGHGNRRSGTSDDGSDDSRGSGDSRGSATSRRRAWRRMIWGCAWRWRRLGVYLVSIVLYLPWMPVMVGQMRQSVFPPVRRAMNASALADAFDVVVLGMTERELPSVTSLALLALALSVFALLVARAVMGGAAITTTMEPTTASTMAESTTRRPKPPAASMIGTASAASRRRDAAILIAGSFVMPLLCMTVWSAVRELTNGGYGFFSVRYLSVVAPFLYMTLALACAPASTRTPSGPTAAAPTARLTRPAPFTIPVHLVYMATLTALVAGTVVFSVRGNHSFDRDDTPGSAVLSRLVGCSTAHPVVAQDEYTYIDAYWYYRDCPAYHFLDADDVPTRGGYAPLRGSDAQLCSLDNLDVDGFTLLSWSTTRDYDRLLGSDAWTRTGVLKVEANAAVTYRMR